MDPPVAETWMRSGQAAQLGAQPAFLGAGLEEPSLGRAGLPDHPAHPALGRSEPLLEVGGRAPAACRAQKFPFATSLSISMSSAKSATTLRSLEFSRSSSLSFFMSWAFRPP